MAKMVVHINEMGKLDGVSDRDKRAYARFKKELGVLAPDYTMAISYRFPRSPKFHRLYFKILGRVFENQETFTVDKTMRKWAEMGAGHVDYIPHPHTGVLTAYPKSIDYESLDDIEFGEVFTGVMSYLRTEHALHFLWPQVDIRNSYEAMEQILMEFNA